MYPSGIEMAERSAIESTYASSMTATESEEKKMYPQSSLTASAFTPACDIILWASSKGSKNTSGNDKELNADAEVQRSPVHPRVGGCLRWEFLKHRERRDS